MSKFFTWKKCAGTLIFQAVENKGIVGSLDILNVLNEIKSSLGLNINLSSP